MSEDQTFRLLVVGRKVRSILRPRRLCKSKLAQTVAWYTYRLMVWLKPTWARAQVDLGNGLLRRGRTEAGLASWRKALTLQPTDWNSQLYQTSVELLHAGQWDAMVGVLRLEIDAQEEFARTHQLDLLGIRFLRRWTYAIGHIALLDFYVKMRILGLSPGHVPVILDANPANRCYLDYWRQYLPAIITDGVGVELLTPLAERLEEHLHVIAFGDGRRMNHVAAQSFVQAQWETENRRSLLTLADAHRECGWSLLQSLGIPLGAWFVSLHVRDTGSGNGRDANISDYQMAIESIVARGGWVIRMGNESMSPLQSMPNVIDYAHSPIRSEPMDVFLWACCRFFIGTNSGPAFVPSTFGVPCVLTNWFPIVRPLPFGQDLGIFKLYWSEPKQRYLTFAEAFASSVEMSESPGHLRSSGIRLVDNKPEDINDVVVEMLERLEGSRRYTVGDQELQSRFKRLKPGFTEELGMSAGRIGQAFLAKYSELL